MERGERFYYIHRKLKSGQCLPLQHFLDALEISRATFKRDLEYLRDRYGAPIVYDRDCNGYRYERIDTDSDRFELPGLWFSPDELHALLTMQALIEQMGTGLLGEPMQLLRRRLAELLGEHGASLQQLSQRVRVFPAGTRRRLSADFPVIAQATLERRRLELDYWTRSRDDRSLRTVSPQRLIHYRGNWYLDAWCHLRQGLRNFAVDAVLAARMLDDEAVDIAPDRLEAELGAAYGIFSGGATRVARLRFSPERSRWVADEIWHPDQQGHWDRHGRFVLRVPYGRDEELVMEILRHGRDVEVLAPASLRNAVAKQRGD